MKNEAWILPLFLQSASIWADHIIIADQKSTDNSKEIALKYPKVIVIDNDSTDLDEDHRDRMLVEKARETVGTNGILFKLDADEIFTPNFYSNDWDSIKRSEEGSVWTFRWIQINENLSSYWEIPRKTVYGAFVDDGRDYTSHGLIHIRDMFRSDKNFIAENIFLLHFQFTDLRRMQIKQRWYQCFERINFPNKSAIIIYRMYHWMYNPNFKYKKIPNEWIEEYKNYKVNLFDYKIENHYWWEDKIKEYFSMYTPQYFRRIETYNPGELWHAEGKTITDKLLLSYLNFTTTTFNKKDGALFYIVNTIDRLLIRLFGF